MDNIGSSPYTKFIQRIDRKNNMGLVRYILAFGVLISHFNIICGANLFWIVSSYDSVCGFFTISGFLLIYPILRGKPIKIYLKDRAWRLLPSYIFIVVLFAVGLALISSLSFKEYFTSHVFWKYLIANLSSLNFIQPSLPGVFTNQWIDAVNGSLWTIKIEWQLSLTVPFIVLLLKKYNINFRKAILCILIISLIYRLFLGYMFETTEKEIYNILGRQLIGQLIFFYCGVLLYTYYKLILKVLYKIFIIATTIFIIFKISEYSSFYHNFIYPFILSVLIISFSLIPHDFAKYIDRGHNISYEIYLCHFPIFQILAYFNVINALGEIYTFILGSILTLLVAIFTYLCVGKLYLIKKQTEHN